jgi:BirA family transcriptional regulator, biotin operon repressor / biotin---[acetyl-CoA-carboxylase] ligase
VLPLAAAVAVCDACEAAAPLSCGIKWPNDVWVKRRKVAGILVEGRPQEGWAVVGVGINVTTSAEELPPELRKRATSLALASGGEPAPSIAELLPPLLRSLEERLDQDPDPALAAWRERDILLGSSVTWEGGSGTAAGIDARGALLVDTAEGRVELDAGEVHLGTPQSGR